jgi:enoyl-CoA hydratase/carnithine racemase
MKPCSSCHQLSTLPLHPQDALEYGLIDEIIAPDKAKAAAAAQHWLRSGRAESEGRLEQWKEYIDMQARPGGYGRFLGGGAGEVSALGGGLVRRREGARAVRLRNGKRANVTAALTPPPPHPPQT